MVFPFYVPLFDFAGLDLFSIIPYKLILIVWLPIVFYHIYRGIIATPLGWLDERVNIFGTSNNEESSSALFIAAILVVGILIWSLAEYTLHRFLFHSEKWMPDVRIVRYLHFILHGIHHFLPIDP